MDFLERAYGLTRPVGETAAGRLDCVDRVVRRNRDTEMPRNPQARGKAGRLRLNEACGDPNGPPRAASPEGPKGYGAIG